MLDICYNFYKQENISYVFVDGSQIEFIRSLKGKIGENTEFENIVKRARQFNAPLTDYMNIIPLYNQEIGKSVIDHAKHYVGISKTVAIGEDNCKPLVKQMRSAKQKETGVLDKDKATTAKMGTLDALESFHYALQYFVHHR